MQDKQLSELAIAIKNTQIWREIATKRACHVEHMTGVSPHEMVSAEACPNWKTDLLRAGQDAGEVRSNYAFAMNEWKEAQAQVEKMEYELQAYMELVLGREKTP